VTARRTVALPGIVAAQVLVLVVVAWRRGDAAGVLLPVFLVGWVVGGEQLSRRTGVGIDGRPS